MSSLVKFFKSRRSTQKRQKQYFEQRRRKQQQQAAGLDSFEEGVNIRGENCKEHHRSLDVLSLQNWSTIAKDCTSTCHPGSPSEFRREDAKVNASTVNSHIFKDPPIIRANPIGPLQSPEIMETMIAVIIVKGTLSGYQPETVSPKKVLFSSSNNRSKAFNGTNNKLDSCKMTTQQSSSVFDLLADDEPNGKSDGSPAREAHVAFSVEGLGKVGAETPPYSPRQPDRCVSYGCPSPLKAARQISSSKNLDYVLNDLEVEVVCALLSTPPSELDGHGRMRNSFDETENNDDTWGGNFCTIIFSFNIMLDMDSWGVLSSVLMAFMFNADFWGETVVGDMFSLSRCRSRDANFLDKRGFDISWNSWPYSMDGNSAEFLKYGNDRLPDDAFEGCHLLKKRDSIIAKEAFNILADEISYRGAVSHFDSVLHSFCLCYELDSNWTGILPIRSTIVASYAQMTFTSCLIVVIIITNLMMMMKGYSPSLKHKTPETGFDFMISERAARKPSLRMNSGFGDTTIQPDWSCFITEDARDNQSLLSEESSSSTAGYAFLLVRDKVTDISPSNSRARRSQRHQNASGFPEKNCRTESIFLKGRQFKNREEIQKGNNVFGSGKSTRIPMLSESSNLDCPFQEKIGSRRNWMLKEGYGSADMNMGFSSPCLTSETKHPLSGSKPWTEDTFDAFVPEAQIDAKFSFGTSKHGGCVKHSPSGSFISENFAFCQQSCSMHAHDSPTFSKVEFGATRAEFTLDSPDFEFKGNHPDSSEYAASRGEKLVLELSAKESASKEKKNRSKFQQTNYEKVETWNGPVRNNMKPMNALESVDNGPDRKYAKDEPLDTSSSVKIPNKSESSVDKKEYHHDAEVSPPCPKGNKEAENEGPGDRKISRDGNRLDSSPPVMMLKSYVLQLLCVQKAPKEASVQTP
ncbi:hypothetical protein POTOM_045944 [Populus tomentosa]|uniref:Uncharacterized protein n=1 Tax=Populus tomentosa TaxID=118781 RepID=A0A8X7YEP3_POPTO|nr:hypothetical protein POTOM_045944 [Populus tomentosa]